MNKNNAAILSKAKKRVSQTFRGAFKTREKPSAGSKQGLMQAKRGTSGDVSVPVLSLSATLPPGIIETTYATFPKVRLFHHLLCPFSCGLGEKRDYFIGGFVVALCLGFVILPAGPPAYALPGQEVRAENGMVVSATIQASRAGVEILKAGGNAVDAAAATGFVLAVTHPAAGNIGGGGFMVARLAGGETFALDFREVAPARAHRDMFLDDEKNVAAGLSLRSPLASGVPGSVDGLLKAWRDHGSGKISRAMLMDTAISLAEDGFEISYGLARGLNGSATIFSNNPGAASIFIRTDGRPWKQGDTLVQKDLAATLRRIAKAGREGFYTGKTAKVLAHQMKETGGLITLEDLSAYASKYRTPVEGAFRGYRIVSMPPPSSGGVMLVQMLNVLEFFDLDSIEWNSAAYIHLLTEVQRRAYADRAVHLGDSDYWDVPMKMLGSKVYARKRGGTISLEHATPSGEVHEGKPAPSEHEETTHYSVVDNAGNAVAVTTTLNGGYGSGIVVEGAGFLLNNEMDDFSSKPGEPNMFGLVGGEANAIEPGKRMLSSMTPTIVLKNDKPFIVTGSPGGATIITTVLQIILNATLHGMGIGEAVSAPRHHSQWLPDRVDYESRGLSSDTRKILEKMGHALNVRRQIGSANSIMITEEGLIGAADPRRNGNSAVGF